MVNARQALAPLILMTLLLGWQAVVAAPTERPPGERTQKPTNGFVWLDIEGEPLPFQSDAEIESFLLTAEVTEKKLIGEGITIPRQLTLTRDEVSAHAIFKDIEMERHKVAERTCGRSRFYLDWRDSHVYDNAAYIVDRLLGINRVPPAVARQFNGSPGTMIIWIENTINENERRKRDLQPPDRINWHRQLQIMYVFNNLIAKRDVNPGNTLIDQNWRVWFIDSSRAFGTVKNLVCPQSITGCERGLWERLQTLDPAEARPALKPVLSKSEIDALFVRRDKLVKRLLRLIDERGEDTVIFDMMDDDPAGDAK